jgi:site-specific DNA-cytosine methylase
VRALELYAGIGGFAAALRARGRGDVVACAIEQSDVAAAVYRANFLAPVLEKNLSGVKARDLAAFEADLWWMSPPCQSFTLRGARRDLDDPRARSFLKVLDLVRAVRPPRIALENVPAFQGSRAHDALLEVLASAEYAVREHVLCPTELGIPNRRERYYLTAAIAASDLADETGAPPEDPRRRPLAAFLDPAADGDPALAVDPAIGDRYRYAMQILDPEDPSASAPCFTAAYGRSHVRSGGFLRTSAGGIRRFSPAEILRLLGFPEGFALPYVRAYGLAGNSVSVHAVTEVLRRDFL